MTPEVTASVWSVVVSLVVVAFWVGWFAISVRHDRRRLRNGFLLIAVLYSGFGLLGQLVALLPGGSDALSWVSLGIFALLGLFLLVLPVLLVLNGLTMVRRERRSFGNLLSLVVGVVMLLTPALVVAPIVLRATWLFALVVMALLATAWLGFVFLGFGAQTLLYRRFAARVPAHAVIVLGSRVVQGRVPPLLAGRLTTAVENARRLAAGGEAVPIVPSGGQGPDEEVPEGVAMARWLEERGVAPELILVEDEARTTRENLRLSVALLHDRGVPSPYLMATNSYHAPRAAMEAMDLGLDVHAVGAPTAGYFYPSAYLREFVAVLRRHRTVHVVAAVGILLVGLLTLLLALQG